ncbi:MAG: hypothetical protein AB7R69_01770 [Candidatus Babeliales bacterium]
MKFLCKLFSVMFASLLMLTSATRAMEEDWFKIIPDAQLKELIVIAYQEIKDSDKLSDNEQIHQCYQQIIQGVTLERTELEKAAGILVGQSTRSCNKLRDILTILCDIQESCSTLFQETFTAIDQVEDVLCLKFQETWTILASITSVTVYVEFNDLFAQTFTAIQEVQDVLCTKFMETWTILNCFTAIPLVAAGTISNSGYYCVQNNIAGTITIAADNVIIDLNNKVLTGNIVATSRTNVKVINGSIEGGGSIGINATTCNGVVVDQVSFSGKAGSVLATTSTCIVVTNCNFEGDTAIPFECSNSNAIEVNNCKFSSNTGVNIIRLSSGSYGATLSNLIINNNIPSGGILRALEFDTSFGAVVNNALISENTATSTVIGFYSTQSNSAIFQNGLISNNTAQHVRGALISSSQDIIVRENSITDNNGSLSAVGVEDQSGLKTLVERCFIATNSSSGFCRGVMFIATATSCVIGNTIISNQGNPGGGIVFVGTLAGNFIQANIIENNTGASSVGIEHPAVPPAILSVFWSNSCFGQTSNFSPVSFAALIPITTFTISTGLFSGGSGRELDNVNIIP